jgi:addiction module RelE/StbE family toxin
VKLLPGATRTLDEIYAYIATQFNDENTAINLIELLEETILSLESMPKRGAKRRVGAYANKGYRQLFVKNFIVIYRIDQLKKQVVIIAIRFSKSHF